MVGLAAISLTFTISGCSGYSKSNDMAVSDALNSDSMLPVVVTDNDRNFGKNAVCSICLLLSKNLNKTVSAFSLSSLGTSVVWVLLVMNLPLLVILPFLSYSLPDFLSCSPKVILYGLDI